MTPWNRVLVTLFASLLWLSPVRLLSQTLTPLFTFDSQNGAGSLWPNGQAPVGGLTLGGDGYLYGTAIAGGSANSGTCYANAYLPSSLQNSVYLEYAGCGTAFKISTSGVLTVLSSPTGPTYPNTVPVVVASPAVTGDYALYLGAPAPNQYGGSQSSPGGFVLGVGDIGAYPCDTSGYVGATGHVAAVPLTLGKNGEVYGTSLPTPTASAKVFKFVFIVGTGATTCTANILTSGSFNGSSAPFVQGSDGSFYGVAPTTGTYGSIVKISPAGALSTLYSFTGGSDGSAPSQALIFGSDGNLYGTTPGNCASASGAVFSTTAGTIFQLTTAGKLTTLFTFPSYTNTSTTPACPSSPLVQASNGLFYGTTVLGGTAGYGTVFGFSPSSGASSIYSFQAAADGYSPNGSLVLTNGSPSVIYGNTASGGINASGNSGDTYGVIYKLTVPPIASLSIKGSASYTGGIATYNLTVSDSGPQAATGVTVTETLPSGVKLVTASSSSSCTQSGQTVTCAVGSVADGGSVSLTVTLSGAADTSATFTVGSSVDYNPNAANDVLTVSALGSGGATDGPIPLWAYALLALSFWWIARRQLRNGGAAIG
jgi:uncharacterized repeat protein (TIGR01451 family)